VIEKKFIEQNVKELKIKEWMKKQYHDLGYAECFIEKTPLGMRITIYSSKPGLIIGRGGLNIERISKILESKFGLESPHVEVRQVEIPELNPHIMSNIVAKQLLNYGANKFKGIGHRNLQRIMKAGAIGAEIIICGRVPSSRARSWRFYAGHLPKTGDISEEHVLISLKHEKLKVGVVGVTVKILPSGVQMADEVNLKQEHIEIKEEVTEIPEQKKETPKQPKDTKKQKGADKK